MSSIVVVGSMAFDSVETPFGKEEKILGGSANYFALAGSYFVPVKCISVVGEEDEFTFSLDEKTILSFDALTLNGNLAWRLESAAGLAASGNFAQWDPQFELLPGDYLLTVDALRDATGPYEFRLLDPDGALKPSCHIYQEHVSDGVAKTIIDNLKVIKIDKQHREASSRIFASCLHSLSQTFHEERPVRQSGQRVKRSTGRRGVDLLAVEIEWFPEYIEDSLCN